MKIDFKSISKVYIVGAASRGKTLKGYLQFLYPNIRICSFLVDNLDENDSEIDGISVRVLPSEKDLSSKQGDELLCREIPVLIATKGIHHTAIRKQLESLGMKDIIPVTVEVDNFFRNEYVKKYMESKKRSFVKIDELNAGNRTGKENESIAAKIYMAKSIYDKPLQTEVVLPEYIKPIQVGAGLTEERLEPDILTDCTGDNISEKNRQYSELTGLYWLWKNAKEEIVGLCHYRRHFVLPAEWKEIMVRNGIDVILPVPTFVIPSIAENYKERHAAADWEFLMDYLKQNSKEDYTIAKKVFQECLYSPCNMFIMRRDILQELCTWMFPILFEVERYGGVKEDVYQNRYPGFVSERLITLFFHKMRDKYKVVYADKTFFA